MKVTNYKTLLAVVGAVLLSAATLISSQSLKSALAFEKKLGQDVAGKNCERIDTPESSTFGKCENVCKDKEVTRDAVNDRWVCKASKTVGSRPRGEVAIVGGKAQVSGVKLNPRQQTQAGSIKAPEGAVILGNKITLKAGYQFEKTSGNTVAVSRANNGGITGSFSCACQEGTPGGGICQLSITKEVALCGGSCKDCRLEIVIDPKAVPFNKAQIQTAPLKKAKN